MQRIFVFLLCVFFFSGCSLRQREIELDKKMTDLHDREQLLALREQSLDLKEQQLNQREKLIDSSKTNMKDSTFILNQQLPGTWSVRMQCIETNCPGSAVGDSKNEQWEFRFQDNSVVASAISNNKVVRIYTGSFTNNVLRLSVPQDSTDLQFGKMVVRLQNVKDKEKEMEGEREIVQASGCRILYALQLKKL